MLEVFQMLVRYVDRVLREEHSPAMSIMTAMVGGHVQRRRRRPRLRQCVMDMNAVEITIAVRDRQI